MGKAFCIIRNSLILIGGVVGAGFVCGKELTVFFGGGNIIIKSLFAAVVFAVFALVHIFAYKTSGGGDKLKKALYGKASFLYDAVFIAGTVIILSSMLSGTDALTDYMFGTASAPVLSLPLFIIVYLLTEIKGNAVKNICGILSFATVVILLVLIFIKHDFAFSSPLSGSDGRVIVYVSMNSLLITPLLFSATDDEKCDVKPSVFIFSFCIGILILLIYSSVLSGGDRALNGDMPMFVLFGGNKVLFCIMAVSLIFAVITSLFSGVFSLKKILNGKKFSRFKCLALAACAFILSRIGIEKVIRLCYPVIGIAGIIDFILCLRLIIAEKFRKKSKKIPA